MLEINADFGLDSPSTWLRTGFNMAQFWATEAALGMAMLAYSTPISATEYCFVRR